MSGFSGYGIQFIRYAGKIECGRDSGTLRSRCRAFFEFAERTGFDCRCGVVAGTDYRAAARLTPLATDLLDVGCGAGNYTLKMLSKRPGLHCTLLDLSRPMLDRAVERVSACSAGRVTAVQRDVREADLGECRYDIVLSGAALHHLRGDEEWLTVFARLYRSLRPAAA